MFRQDYRMNKIFLPFPRSAGQAVGRQKVSIDNILALFSAKAEFRFHGFIWSFLKANAATREIIKSILLILSESSLALCLKNYELIST